MSFEIMLSAALFAASQGRVLPEVPLTREAVLPPNLFLVKAHALSATKGGKQSIIEVGSAPFEIDHVYVGPGDLKGKAFFATEIHVFVLNFSMSSWYEVTPIQKGEVGIWWIYKGKQGLASVYGSPRGTAVSHPMGKPPETVFMPALKDGSKAGDAIYEMAVARAEVFEKISHANDKDRLKVIDDYVRSHDSIKGAAALMLLLTANDPIMISKDASLPLHERFRVEKFPKIADYVLPFSKDKSLSPRVQLEVEQILFLNREGWKGSPEEWRMIKHWYTGTWKEKDNVPWEVSDEKALVDSPSVAPPFFSSPPYTRAFTLVENLELATAGLANDARSDRFKAELIISLRRGLIAGIPRIRSVESLGDAEEGFAFLVRTIHKDAAPSKRVAAAKLVVVFAPLSAEHRAVLDRLRGEKLDDNVRKEINGALLQK
jgi:hypothetical protein